jgi:RNA polymerase sigma-70 factor (ECF subfamily)
VDEIEIPTANDQANGSVDHQELAERLRAALTRIPENQAEAFSLRWIDELSNQEVAERMQTTANNVRVLLHRARSALQKLLGDEWGPRP